MSFWVNFISLFEASASILLPHMVSKVIVWGSFVIFATTTLSRLLALVRESLIAYLYGAQAVTDSYVMASVLPTTIAGLIGGALTTVFISVFVEERQRLGEAKAWEGAQAVLGSSFLVLVLMLGLSYGLLPLFLEAIAPGFDPLRFSLVLKFSYIMLPSLLMLGLLGLFTGVFQSYGLFSAPALTGLLFNLCLILFLTTARENPLISLGVGTVAAVTIQVVILLYLAKRRWSNFRFSFSFKHPTVFWVWKLLTPIFLGSGIGYINLIIDRIFASLLPPGAVAALNFAARVKDLPSGLFGMAISQAVYPALAFKSAQDNKTHLKGLFSQALESTWLLVIPASLGFMVLSPQTIAFLFERGAFTPTATKTTSEAFFYYSLGIVASCTRDLASKCFFAQKDTKTPVKIATLGLLTNMVLNWILIHPLAHKGLALATSVSATVNASLLLVILRRQLGGIEGLELLKNLVKISLASGAMTAVILPLREFAYTWWGYLSVITIGAGTYGALIFLLRPRCVKTLLSFITKSHATSVEET